ncbi:MAG: spore coat protein [Cyanobacteria bacterium REEB67]|nr:spore coat protein [Cyanobacteria bacterium REEB67]
MKKYMLAALLAAFTLIGPSIGSANAQGYFYRGGGGPTFVDRLFGNGYNYGNYGGYNPYAGYSNYNRCGGGMFGGYGWNNGWNNGWGRGWGHHHHHCW